MARSGNMGQGNTHENPGSAGATNDGRDACHPPNEERQFLPDQNGPVQPEPTHTADAFIDHLHRFWPRDQTELERSAGAPLKTKAGANRNSDSTSPLMIGRFQLLRELGRGGFGIVYLARDTNNESQVAIKVPHADLQQSPELRQRFEREARTAQSLSHPHINPIYETGTDPDQQFIASHYCAGPTLRDWLKCQDLPIAPESAAKLIMLLAEAVAHAHECGVLHRDLKPGNVLLDKIDQERSGETPSRLFEGYFPRLCDFGLAKILDTDDRDATTVSGVLLGTPQYMSPEQASGKPADVRQSTDIYSLGVMLYELLAGAPPFGGDTNLETLRRILNNDPVPLRQLRPAISRDLETICLKCLEKDPSRRYASAGQLAVDLRRYLRRDAIVAKPPSYSRRFGIWVRRHPIKVVLTLVASALLTGLPAALLWHTLQIERAYRLAEQQRVSAEHAAVRARDSEQKALLNEAAVRQHTYASEMRLAHELLKEGQFTAMAALLDRYDHHLEDEPDRRGFEWHYLNRFRNIEKRTWQAHAGELSLLAFAADGRVLLTASETDHCAKAWQSPEGTLLATFPIRTIIEPREHKPADISHDGKMVATILDGQQVGIWNTATGQEIARLEHGSEILCLAFSPDGQFLLIGGYAYSQLWRCLQWQVYDVTGTIQSFRIARFSPDGNTVAGLWSPSYSTDVDLFDVRSRKLKQKISHWFPVLDIAYTPDGKTLATLSDGPEGSVIGLFNADTGAWIQNIRWNQGKLCNLRISADGRLLASARQNGSLHFWELASGHPQGFFRGAVRRMTQFSFSPDDQTLATSSDRGTVSLWDRSLLGRPQPVDVSASCRPPLVFSPRENRLAVAGTDRTLLLVDAATGRIDIRLKGHLDSACDMAFSPDGQQIAAIDGRHVQCWSTVDGRDLWKTDGLGLLSISWSPGAPLLAVGAADGSVRLCDANTGTETARLTAHTGEVRVVRFFPDGRHLASAGSDRTLRIWDVVSHSEARDPLTHDYPVLSLAVSQDGRELAAGLVGGRLVRWQFPEIGIGGAPEHRDIPWFAGFEPRMSGQASSVDFSPDGAILGTAGPGGIFRAQATATADLTYTLSGRGLYPTAAVFSHDGSMLASISGSNELTFSDNPLRHCRKVLGAPLPVVRDLAFSIDGRSLAVACDHRADIEFPVAGDLPVRANIRLPATNAGSGTAPVPPASQDFLPWQATTDSLRFWDIATGGEQFQLAPQPALDDISRVAWSGAGNLLAGAGGDGRIWIWNMSRSQLVTKLDLDDSLRAFEEAASSSSAGLVSQSALIDKQRAPLLAFSPDGAEFVAVDQHGVVKAWHTNNWGEPQTFPMHCLDATSLDFSPDGAILAVNHRGQVRLLDSRTGQVLTSIGGEADSLILCGRFSADGEMMALGTLDGTVEFLDTSSHAISATLVGHVDGVASLAFSPDKRTLATGSWDTTVRLWDLASRKEVAVLEGHRGRVHSVAFSPDGAHLVSGGEIDDRADHGLGELFIWRTSRSPPSTSRPPPSR